MSKYFIFIFLVIFSLSSNKIYANDDSQSFIFKSGRDLVEGSSGEIEIITQKYQDHDRLIFDVTDVSATFKSFASNDTNLLIIEINNTNIDNIDDLESFNNDLISSVSYKSGLKSGVILFLKMKKSFKIKKSLYFIPLDKYVKRFVVDIKVDDIKESDNLTYKPQILTSKQQLGYKYFFAKDYHESYKYFMQDYLDKEKEGLNNVENIMNLGDVSFELKEYYDAIYYYNKLLEERPDANRIRLKLAQSLLFVNDSKRAQRHINYLIKSKPPKKIRNGLDSLLKKLKNHKDWKGTVALGYTFNDNITGISASDSVSYTRSDTGLTGVFNPYELGIGKKEDHGIITAASLDYNPVINEDFRFENKILFSNIDYSSENEYSSRDLLLKVSPVYSKYISNKMLTLSTPLILSKTRLDYNPYRDSYSLGLAASLAMNSKLKLTFKYDQTHSIYQKSDDKGLNNISDKYSSSALYRIFDDGDVISKLFLIMTYKMEDNGNRRDNAALSFDSDSIIATLYAIVNKKVKYYLSISKTDKQYSGNYSWNSYAREDDSTKMINGLIYSFKYDDKDFDLSINHRYVQNDSNMELFKYDANLFTIKLSHDF